MTELRLLELKIMVTLMVSTSLVLTSTSIVVWQYPHPDILHREIVEWAPEIEFAPPNIGATVLPLPMSVAKARPLFRVSRTPFSASAPAAFAGLTIAVQHQSEDSSFEQMQFVLRGIIIEVDHKMALISSQQSPDGKWVPVGGELSGWRIINLDERSVTLSSIGQSHIVNLYVDNNSDIMGN